MQAALFLPELMLTIMALILFGATLSAKRSGATSGLALALAALATAAAGLGFGAEGSLFFAAYRIDAFSQSFKVLITFGLFLVIYLGPSLTGVEERLRPEYYLFLTISALGLVFLSSAVELLTILVSLEISSYALYVVIPFRNQRQYRVQMEAGIKYVLFGALATGISLYGMSYIYGFAGTTYVSELAARLPALLAEQPLALIGMVLMLGGFFYKLALFPMHFWTPDVYEGAANETTTYVATLPKVGAVALLIRLVTLGGVDVSQFTWILGACAVLSMTVGNLSALVQDDLKRLLAYSSIAHAGYVMLGILSVGGIGSASAIYYIAGYLVMNLACFFVIYQLAPDGHNITFADLKGLSRRSPLLAFTLAAGAFGMAGIPPTVGFTGKFIIFTAAIEKGLYSLVILAVINAGISAFYYLKMVRAAYCQPLVGGETVALRLGVPAALLGVVLVLLIILVGIFPQSFLAIAQEAVAALS